MKFLIQNRIVASNNIVDQWASLKFTKPLLYCVANVML